MDIRVILGKGPRGEHMDKDGNVRDIESIEHWDSVHEEAGDKLVIVDWYSKYCMPCKVISPIYAELSEKYVDVVFVKVNALELMELAEKCGEVHAFPTFQLYQHGELVDAFSGASAQQLERLLTDHDAIPDQKYLEDKKRARDKARSVEIDNRVVTIHSKEEFKENIDNAGDKVICVLFHASWVPACKGVIKLLGNMSSEEEYKDVTFLKVDFEQLPEPCDECQVRAIPTLVLFKGGIKVDMFPSVSRARIEKKLRVVM